MRAAGSVYVPLLLETVVGLLTVIEKAGKAAWAVPLLTEITMSEFTPTLAAAGVPVIAPVAMLKVAQDGRFCTLKESVAPPSLAVGVKL